MVTIKVENKVAENITKDEFWVCGNTDYKVEFEFDEVWNSHELKTALFAFNGVAVPVPFTGNVCEVPKLLDCTICQVGVFAGDLITTTPALVGCKRSITDIGGEIPPPQDDVYEKLVTMIESGMLKGEKGDKGDKGEKGDAGAIKFIPVTRTDNEDPKDDLPKENIDTSAIYLLPIGGDDEQNRFTEYAYINGKWEILGAISIQVDHSEYVKFTDIANTSKAGVVRATGDSYGISINSNNGNISLSTANDTELEKQTVGKAVKVSQISKAVKIGITTNTETLTDEEKTSACDWLGALKAQNPDFTDGGATRGYVYFIEPNGNQVVKAVQILANGNTIPLRNPNGNFYVSTPTLPYECTSKGYVDSKIAELLARIEALEGK